MTLFLWYFLDAETLRFGPPAENVKGQGSKSQDSGHDTNHLSDLAMIVNG